MCAKFCNIKLLNLGLEQRSFNRIWNSSAERLVKYIPVYVEGYNMPNHACMSMFIQHYDAHVCIIWSWKTIEITDAHKISSQQRLTLSILKNN